MKPYTVLLLLLTSIAQLNGQSYFPVPEPKDTMQFKKGAARTAWLLTSADTEVKILVYGQSISEQAWWMDVRDFVRSQFPLANITFINKAIGGFSSERLKLMAENDVVSFYPDLILFHDYGNEADYEWIIQTIRRRTTAEIAIQTDHLAGQRQDWHDKHSQEWLPSICNKYGLALIDVRSAWKNYVKVNNLDFKDLLKDGVHLNAHGNYLMASIIKRYFANLKRTDGTVEYVKELKAGMDFSAKGKMIDIPIQGNRIDLVWKPNSKPGKPIDVTIDGNKPSAIKACYYYTRPAFDTVSFLKKIGQVLGMTLTDKSKEEEWEMSITSTDSVRQQIAFSLKGSLTGEDGSGTSENTFISNSGKIVIEPAYWFRAKEFARFEWVRPGDVLKWRVRCMCKDQVQPQPSSTITIVQGLDNVQHRLRLTGKSLNSVERIRIYQPPLQ